MKKKERKKGQLPVEFDNILVSKFKSAKIL